MAGACGCTEACNCVLQGINGITVSGSGQSYDPYIIGPPAETPFAAVNTDNTIGITPGGPYGHNPVVNLIIDPASTATVTKTVDGLRIDAPPAGGGLDVPIGVVLSSAGPTVPAGYLPCDGLPYATILYPLLFAEIGYTYGGAGATFNVPDHGFRASYGPGSAPGTALGDDDGLLLAQRLPGHSHTGPLHNHAFGTLAGTTAATTAAAALSPGAGTLQQFGVNDNIAGGEAWLNVTTGTTAAPPATPTNNNSGDGEGPGSSGDVTLSDHKHGIASVAVTMSGATGDAGTGATSIVTNPYIVFNKIIRAA